MRIAGSYLLRKRHWFYKLSRSTKVDEMANIAITRIKREFKEVRASEEARNEFITLELKEDNQTKLDGCIQGPPETPYEGGCFKLSIDIPETYPFNPPKVKFDTPIWHPNISSVTGAICLDILKDQWAAAMTLRTVLLSIQALLGAAEPDDPQDAVVAKQYKSHYSIYKETAKHWTNVYASGPNRVIEYEDKIKCLTRMGFDERRSRAALSSNNWNMEQATESLINS